MTMFHCLFITETIQYERCWLVFIQLLNATTSGAQIPRDVRKRVKEVAGALYQYQCFFLSSLTHSQRINAERHAPAHQHPESARRGSLVPQKSAWSARHSTSQEIVAIPQVHTRAVKVSVTMRGVECDSGAGGYRS